MYIAIKAFAISSLALTLAACDSPKDANKSNFSKAIQAYLDTQNGLCAAIPAKEVPFTMANEDKFFPQNKRRADALAAAGLLNKTDSEVKAMFGNKMEPATEYQVTDLGNKYLVAKAADTLAKQDAFCAGKYSIIQVDNFSEPSDMMGMKVSQVNFRYKVESPADWAQLEELRVAYRDFEDQSQGDIKGKAALILTNDGWIHERLFKK